MRHLSIRVPWHDSGWHGRVCAAPGLNASCLKLKRIAENRDDAAESAVAGKSLDELEQSQWPACVAERMAIMAPFEYTRWADHPYNRGPESTHGHFKSTPLRHPPYSAAAVPFSWLLKENMETLAEEHDLDVRAEYEPDLGFDPNWVQDHRNQRALLDAFAGHLKPERSLCFFYAKQVPFVEDSNVGRVLIGVGRIKHLGDLREYDYTTDELDGKVRSILWERMIQHSIQPSFEDGFLLPYRAAIAHAAENPDFNPAELAAFSPPDRMLEFSHASQLVGHDGAIGSLLACAESLHRANGVLKGPWEQCLQWIDARLGELWTARGPCPVWVPRWQPLRLESPTFVARALAERAGENEDPWPLVARMFVDPSSVLPVPLDKVIGGTMASKWSRLPEDRRALLQLLQPLRAFAGAGEAVVRQGKSVPSMVSILPTRRLSPIHTWSTSRLG
ncbi:MAG: hypothetical protein U5L08_07825 [Xanthomonadales bacterium]|nr:hypothetical protein [Xanthomonadales bacterium]